MAQLIPGLAAAALIAQVSNTIHSAIVIGGQKPVSAVVIAIITGMVLRGLLGPNRALGPGLMFSVKRILKLAIILLGFDLQLRAVFQTGTGTLGVIVFVVAAGILITIYIGRLLGLREELSLLVGTGTAICGATAIVAAAPAVGADDSDISYAIGTITMFGILAIFAYPAIGKTLAMSDSQFGTWAGTAVHETAQVLAAGFSYSDAAGKIAAVVKLVRTTLLAPLVFILGAVHHRRKSSRFDFRQAMQSFPYFVLWFLAASVARTIADPILGASSGYTAFLTQAKEASKFLIVVAMAATGLLTDFSRMKKVGFGPFVAGLAASVVVGALSLALIML